MTEKSSKNPEPPKPAEDEPDVAPAVESEATTASTADAVPLPVDLGLVGRTREFLWTYAMSIMLAVVLLGSLIWAAGPWNVLTSTRMLLVVIHAGFVQYTDNNAGFIEGVGDYEDYFIAQDPIEWYLVFIAMGLFVVFYFVRSIQFHRAARLFGMEESYRDNAGTYMRSTFLDKVFPLRAGQRGLIQHVTKGDEEKAGRYRSLFFLLSGFIFFELVVYLIGAMLVVGWADALAQVGWAIFIMAVALWWVRTREPSGASFKEAIREHVAHLSARPADAAIIAVLSLLAFGLEDVAAYIIAMAFTSEHVILNVDFTVLLLGIIGSYIARMIRVTPGGIGQFEWGFAAGLWIGGMGFPEAAIIALLDGFFRYSTLALIFIGGRFWRRWLDLMSGTFKHGLQFLPEHRRGADALTLPVRPTPRFLVLAGRLAILALLGYAVLYWDELSILLSDLWLLRSIGMEDVFWTNFASGASLFVTAFVLTALAVAGPVMYHKLAGDARRLGLLLAPVAGLGASYFITDYYLEFLLAGTGSFGELDPVFGNDIGFYVFTLPAVDIAIWSIGIWAGFGLLASLVCAWSVRDDAASPKFRELLLDVATPWTQGMFTVMGLCIAVGLWMSRYDLLLADNTNSAIFNGAEALDVTGFFSTVNALWVSAIVAAILGGLFVFALQQLRSSRTTKGAEALWNDKAKLALKLLAALILFDVAFVSAVAVRDVVSIQPNQPVNQLEFISHHLEATRKGYDIAKVEEVEWLPKGPGEPLPNKDRLMQSPTIKNAPLWPTYVSYLEPVLDPQHGERIVQTEGDGMVYGPTLEVFRQHQKLRTYYNFLSIDPVRYTINGETKLFASGVRELPLLAAEPWLTWWGQRFVLYTHGHGLVISPVADIGEAGSPVFVSKGIPTTTRWPELKVNNPSVYYGEGAQAIAFSNLEKMQELDYPTTQGRALNTYPKELKVGVPIDGLLKRVVFGWKSGFFFDILFSDLIDAGTRVHFIRDPMERLGKIAPFVYWDSNPIAVAADGDMVWMINGITTTDAYPYSKHEYLGDKSVARSPFPVERRRVNYMEDSVKATIDAYTGKVKLYRFKTGPVINAWSEVYPSMFTDVTAMPLSVRSHVTYPVSMFHIQFDDIFILYHMNDAMYWFNQEDAWDDSDEVLGPIMDTGKSITFSIEPYMAMLETQGKGPLPKAATKSQFAMMAVFTPENARNLRAVPIAYQDGKDYGRLVVLQVPKGEFVLGPEQADATIDQDPEISRHLSWWNRMGADVIRGHTTTLPIGDELLYIEPIFLRSQQNPKPQLQRVIVVFREKAHMAETLQDALLLALGQKTAAQQEEADEARVRPPHSRGRDDVGPPPGKGPPGEAAAVELPMQQCEYRGLLNKTTIKNFKIEWENAFECFEAPNEGRFGFTANIVHAEGDGTPLEITSIEMLKTTPRAVHFGRKRASGASERPSDAAFSVEVKGLPVIIPPGESRKILVTGTYKLVPVHEKRVNIHVALKLKNNDGSANIALPMNIHIKNNNDPQ